MKQSRIHILLLALITVVSTVSADSSVPANPVFRSPASNTVDKVTGMYPYHIHLSDEETDKKVYWTLSGTVKYNRSFNNKRISELLFGNALTEIPDIDECGEDTCFDGLVVSGTGTDIAGNFLVNRGDRDLMAENFFLPRDFKSNISINPRVTTVLANFDLYMGFNQTCEGVYFRIYGPYQHSTFDLDMQEQVVNPGTVGYDAGFFDRVAVARADLLTDFSSYMKGETPNLGSNAMTFAAVDNLPAPSATTPVDPIDTLDVPAATALADEPLIVHGLQFSKMSQCANKRSGFGELHFELGYDLWMEEDYHLGFDLQFAVPTQGKTRPEYLFAPQLGNGGLWQVGGGAHGHYNFWKSCDERKTFGVVFEADLNKLFNAKQCFTFDLACSGLSRYMLVQKLDTVNPVVPIASAAIPAVAAPLTGAFTREAVSNTRYQFAGEYQPLANISTVSVKAGSSLQVDITAMVNYTCGGFNWNLGYNFWMRTCDDVSLRSLDCTEFPYQKWALKGDASVYGFTTAESQLLVTAEGVNLAAAIAAIPQEAFLISAPEGYPFPISATESHADIHVGTNVDQVGAFLAPSTNPNIDKPTAFGGVELAIAAAQSNTIDGTPAPTLSTPTTFTFADINATVKPRFISPEDFDLCSNTTKGMSNKLFTHFNYTCLSRKCWAPYIGAGAEVEFGRNAGGGCCPPAGKGHGCQNAALSQWGVWVKLGLTYY